MSEPKMREDRDAIEARIEALEQERSRLARYVDGVFDQRSEAAEERIDAISDELAALEDVLDEADDMIRDADPEQPYRPRVL